MAAFQTNPSAPALASSPRSARLSLIGLVAAGAAPLGLLTGLLGSAPARAQQAGALALARTADPQLRVLLLEAPTLRVAADSGLRLRDAGGGELLRLPAGSALSLRLSAGRVEAQPSGGDGAPPRTLTVAELWLEPLADPTGNDTLQLEQRRYRGRLQIRPEASRLRAVNYIPLETYLPSVVGSEMPASWPLEALRAQAVAARTYALRQRSPNAPFDLRSTVASQMYKGLEAETPSTREAVRTTRGLVLMYGNTLINAVFHSSSGGSTENSGDIWSRQLPYLVSVPDYDQGSPVHSWEKTLSPQLLGRAFAEIGGARRIDILSTTSSGRVRQARVIGPAGQLVLSGPELRSRLGLKSSLVHFQAAPFAFGQPPLSPEPAAAPAQGPMAIPVVVPGSRTAVAFGSLLSPPPPQPLLPPSAVIVAIGRGFGHGVGMSQWGAFALAQRGTGYEQILQHYYRGAQLRPFRDTTTAAVVSDAASEPGSTVWMSRSLMGDRRP